MYHLFVLNINKFKLKCSVVPDACIVFQVEFPAIVTVMVVILEYAATGDVKRSYYVDDENYRVILYGSPKLLRDWRPNNQYTEVSDQWPLLLTWFNFNPSMDK